MQVISFNFTKISAERLKLDKKIMMKGDMKINTDISFSTIEKEKFEVIGEDIIKAKFTFSVNHEPDIAKMVLEGFLILRMDKKQMDELLKAWKSKKIPEQTNLGLLNFVMQKCNLKALQLEEELNLPPHFSMPRISKKN